LVHTLADLVAVDHASGVDIESMLGSCSLSRRSARVASKVANGSPWLPAAASKRVTKTAA
jgi:hypothetical protein